MVVGELLEDHRLLRRHGALVAACTALENREHRVSCRTGCGAEELSAAPLKRITAMNREFAVSYKDGQFGIVSNTCNHAGGPLGKGRLDGEYIVCPWHNWKFHRVMGKVNLGSKT
jgi:nitrite reductase/ring-hydroxylating ferredoxin subunit